MKKVFIILCVSVFAVSCGSKDSNKVNSADSSVSGSEGLEVGAIASFTGEYDILRKDSQDCSNSIRIVSECAGVKVLSNGFNAAEEFCNINKGPIRANDRLDMDNRNPRNPENNGEVRTVTLEGNVLKSELRINPSIAFTNTLTMNANGVLTKVSNLKSRTSRCIYQKR